MINIGINGYGRIGRVLHRLVDLNPNLNVVAINDINPDINNIAYLANYDSTYGHRDTFLSVKDKTLISGDNQIDVFHKPDISKVPWNDLGVKIVVDSSGILENLELSQSLRGKVDNIIVTNSPGDDLVDKTIIYGVNEHEIDKKSDFLLSSSICDATAITSVLKPIDEEFNILQGFITTLHPWLGYQNLLDGPSKSYAVPGEIIDNYALGRASSLTIIPKNTSAISASCKVLPNLKGKFLAHSYRVPTSIVSSADITIGLKKDVNYENFLNFLNKLQAHNPTTISINSDALVSSDFIKSSHSAIIDKRFLNVKDNYVKLMLWYDNEWGYSSRVVDLMNYISK